MTVTVYIDEVFFLNFLIDYLLLLCAGKLAGEVVVRKRLLLAALLGAAYAAAVWLPDWTFLNRPLFSAAVWVGMVLIGFGVRRRGLRIGLVFLGVSAAFGGGVLVLEYFTGGAIVLDLKMLLLATAGCYAFLTLIFQGGVRHTGRELAPVEVSLSGRTCRLTALVDTGNTLTDPLTGQMVMVAEGEKLSSLFVSGERPTAQELRDPVTALEHRSGSSYKWRLLPYRAVGVECGLLLTVKVDSAKVGSKDCGSILVALSPTPVSDGGGYNALIGA